MISNDIAWLLQMWRKMVGCKGWKQFFNIIYKISSQKVLSVHPLQAKQLKYDPHQEQGWGRQKILTEWK